MARNTPLILNGIESTWKYSHEILVLVDMIASCDFCRSLQVNFYAGNFRITSQRCSTGLRVWDCEGYWRILNSKWCSWNQFGKLWLICINSTIMCQENIPHTFTPPSAAWTVDTRQGLWNHVVGTNFFKPQVLNCCAFWDTFLITTIV